MAVEAVTITPLMGREGDVDSTLDERWWCITDSPEWVSSWMQERRVQRGWHPSLGRWITTDNQAAATNEGEWTDTKIGKSVEMAPRGVWDNHTAEITVACDGAVDNAACEAAMGSYGWVAFIEKCGNQV